MLPAAGKGERRNLRGSARLSSKMSGKLPRLRALRPRTQQQQQRTRTDAATAVDPTHRPEGNLKEDTNDEVNADVRRRDARTANAAKAAADATRANEVNEDDERMSIGEDEMTEPDVVVERSEEAIDLEACEQTSYECKSCKPTKTLPSIKAYFEHLRKEHKYKVRSLFLALLVVFPSDPSNLPC